MTHADGSASALLFRPSIHFLDGEPTLGGDPDVA
jgi:hypothetical protein